MKSILARPNCISRFRIGCGIGCFGFAGCFQRLHQGNDDSFRERPGTCSNHYLQGVNKLLIDRDIDGDERLLRYEGFGFWELDL